MVEDRNGLTSDVQVRVANDAIIVTLAGTGYSVTYRKTAQAPWLVATDIHDDPNSPINRFEFRARAWTPANDKARELGGLCEGLCR